MPRVTVAIPTRNRFAMLQRAVEHVLAQTLDDFELIVIDNASNDRTREIQDVGDPRIRYVRNERDLGIIGNWNRAVHLSNSEYLNIFHDDDVMYPQFLDKSVSALNEAPSAGFTFPLVRRVDRTRRFLNMWFTDYGKSGLITGTQYLEWTIRHGRCISLAPSMVFRKHVHSVVGLYRQVYSFNAFDFNMWLSIARHFDVYHIPETLFEYTIHEEQMSERHWRVPASPTGPIGGILEILDCIARLSMTEYARDQLRNEFLAQRTLDLTKQLHDLVAIEIPDL